jgi:hypothetical protein
VEPAAVGRGATHRAAAVPIAPNDFPITVKQLPRSMVKGALKVGGKSNKQSEMLAK